ncbi:MAG: DNA gyrase inhibitor YacG [Caulobacteraceae bacterium]
MRKPRPTAPCPICGKPSVAEHRPFCSARCSKVDLQRWLSGRYVIGGEASDEQEPPPEDLQDSDP